MQGVPEDEDFEEFSEKPLSEDLKPTTQVIESAQIEEEKLCSRKSIRGENDQDEEDFDEFVEVQPPGQ